MSTTDPLGIAGRTVIVTGASGGIGSGIVRRFGELGAVVVAQYRSTPVPPGAAIAGAEVRWLRADLTDGDAPGALVAAALEATGRLDALVNNAGIQPVVPLAEMSDGAFREMLEVNVTAVHRLTQAAAAAMVARGGGAVVHVASIEGLQPAPGHAHYATAKAAVIMHARAAALEYGPVGVRVNAVSPGLIDRPGLADEWPSGVARWRSAAPLGRLGTPRDVADACVFLCSPMASWVSGANLVVDGGVSSHPTW
jgi:3-oxoacyl-[acyl-carrier protein] reductase